MHCDGASVTGSISERRLLGIEPAIASIRNTSWPLSAVDPDQPFTDLRSNVRFRYELSSRFQD